MRGSADNTRQGLRPGWLHQHHLTYVSNTANLVCQTHVSLISWALLIFIGLASSVHLRCYWQQHCDKTHLGNGNLKAERQQPSSYQVFHYKVRLELSCAVHQKYFSTSGTPLHSQFPVLIRSGQDCITIYHALGHEQTEIRVSERPSTVRVTLAIFDMVNGKMRGSK
jgi:hypothetical protein